MELSSIHLENEQQRKLVIAVRSWLGTALRSGKAIPYFLFKYCLPILFACYNFYNANSFSCRRLSFPLYD